MVGKHIIAHLGDVQITQNPKACCRAATPNAKKKSLLANKLAHRRAARDLFFYVHAQVHHRSGSCSCAPRGFTVFLITLQHVNAPLPRLQRLTSLLVSMLLTGFDFGSCPGWSACERHPVYSLWRRASQNVSVRSLFAHGRVKRCPPPHTLSLVSQFAEMACGNVTVLLNGSVVEAFNRERYRSASGAKAFDQK